MSPTYTKKTVQISIVGLFLATIFLSLVPVFQVLHKGGYAGVPPAFVDDDLYYYARMKEVTDGKPFIGNPYFIEHSNDRSVAFFVADWVAAIPLLLGIPSSLAIIINFIFWSLIFVLLAYLICRATDMPPPYSAIASFFLYCEVYWLILRPVAMQEVFPFFLLFILALVLWLRNPDCQRRTYFFIIASALTFYIYTYLWQIVFITLGVTFIHFFLKKRWVEIKELLLIALGTGLLALPAIIYTIYQIRAPFYWETIGRVGLVQSHLPTISVYLYGRWAILLVILYFCLQKWLKTRPEKSNIDYAVMFAAIYSGFGLFIMSISNVVTGKELETAQHIGRLITFWVALFFPILLWRLWLKRVEVLILTWPRLVVVGTLSLLCLGFLVSNLNRSLPFKQISAIDISIVQGYAEPLGWLEQQKDRPVVIWADDELSKFVPILTKHYTFWSSYGGLHLMPTREVEDRYLASRIGMSTKDEIFTSYQAFEGAGAGWRYLDAFNKNRLRCFLHMECKENQNMRQWIGEANLDKLFNRQIELKKDIYNIMKKYSISYVIADKVKNEDSYFRVLPSAVEVWHNNQFVIYEIH